VFMFPLITSAQYLTGVDPDEGQQGQTLELMISGQNTNFTQATYVSVSLAQGTSSIIYPYSVTVQNDEQVKAVFNFTYQHNTGSYDLFVQNPPYYPMQLEDAFQLLPGPNPPGLTGVDPATAQTGQTLDITISGQFTNFQAGTLTVWFSQGSETIYPNYNQIISDTEIKSNFTFQFFHPDGYYDVNTFSIDGHLTLPDGFLLTAGPAPSITSLQPPMGMAGTFIEFEIFGENTHFQDATEVVAFLENSYGGVDLDIEIVNNEYMTASLILPYDLGNYPITNYYLYVFTNLDGPMFLYNAFTALQNPVQPYISAIEPDSAYLGTTVSVEVFAQNTFFTYNQWLTVWLESDDWNYPYIWPEDYTVIDDEKIIATFYIPTYVSAGNWDFMMVDDISGEMMLEGGFNIIDTVIGINERFSQSPFTIFPNPALTEFNIRTATGDENCTVTIHNLAGLQMELRKVKFEPGLPVRFNIDNYPEGIYIVKIITQNNIYVEKIIKN
jgi:hypothetical protein